MDGIGFKTWIMLLEMPHVAMRHDPNGNPDVRFEPQPFEFNKYKIFMIDFLIEQYPDELIRWFGYDGFYGLDDEGHQALVQINQNLMIVPASQSPKQLKKLPKNWFRYSEVLLAAGGQKMAAQPPQDINDKEYTDIIAAIKASKSNAIASGTKTG